LRYNEPNGKPSKAAAGGAPVSRWKLGGLSVRELARRVWKEFWADEILDRAAALSYYFLFALFPALLFLTALLGLLPFELMEQLMAYADAVLPADAASLVRKTLAEIARGANAGLLSAGIATALWGASGGMLAGMAAMNIAFDVEERRPWWKRRLVALTLTVGFVVFIPASLLLLIFGERIGTIVADRLGLGSAFVVLWTLLRWPIMILMALIAIGLVYSLAPAKRVRWAWVTPGSLFAIGSWLLVSLGLRLYVSHFGNYNATYGSIGSVIVLLSWLFLTGVTLLTGAEIDSEIERARRAAATAALGAGRHEETQRVQVPRR
jgi:membrane protein